MFVTLLFFAPFSSSMANRDLQKVFYKPQLNCTPFKENCNSQNAELCFVTS